MKGSIKTKRKRNLQIDLQIMVFRSILENYPFIGSRLGALVVLMFNHTRRCNSKEGMILNLQTDTPWF